MWAVFRVGNRMGTVLLGVASVSIFLDQAKASGYFY
jgi:hypothetical protein